MATIDTIQGGGFQDPGGNVLAGGKITFRLNSPAQTINDGQAVQDIPVSFTLDGSGNVPVGSNLYGNDQLTPSNTAYIVNIYNANGALARGPENWLIVGASPIDLGTIVAISSAISYPGVVLLNPTNNQIINGSLTVQIFGVTGATPTSAGGTSGPLAFGQTNGFGNGSASTAVTTTTKGSGSGPATPQTVVRYLEIDIGGTKYWIPLTQ